MENDTNTQGQLYIVATPIGNLEDMTYRAVRILQQVDIIAAEDTRHTLKLLNHFEIKKRMVSYHKFNAQKASVQILSFLQEGSSVALVTDAGMPCISDPGWELVAEAHKCGINVTVLPGACAAITGLALSGVNSERFFFEGFLPKSGKNRKERLRALSEQECSVILYEAPHQLIKTLRDLESVLGDRRIVLCNELTKLFEKVRFDSAAGHLQFFAENAPRGEYVLILDVPEKKDIPSDTQQTPQEIRELILAAIQNGMTKKEAIKQVAEDLSLPKSTVYEQSFDIDVK